MPSSTGIRMSMSTTSGRVRRTTSTASRPSAATPTHLDAAGLQHHLQPGPDQLLVVGDHHAGHAGPDRQGGRQLEPLRRHAVGQRAAEHRDPLGHPEQAEPAAGAGPAAGVARCLEARFEARIETLLGVPETVSAAVRSAA